MAILTPKPIKKRISKSIGESNSALPVFMSKSIFRTTEMLEYYILCLEK